MLSRIYGGITIAAVLVMGLVLVACGSDSSSTDTTGTATALSKSEFLKQGNAICAKGNKATNQLVNQTFTNGQKPTQAQLQQFTTQVVPIVQGQIDGLRALGAPSGEEQQVNKILDDAQSALDKVQNDPSQFLNGDPFKQANQEAKAYGLTACGAS
jgi:hypothetical protein